MPRLTTTLVACVALTACALVTQAFVPAPFPSSSTRSLSAAPSRYPAAAARVRMSAPAATVPPAAAAAAAARPRREINILQLIESNGGYMAKVQVKNFNEATEHTVITSKELYQQTCEMAGKGDGSFSVEDYFRAVFKYMIGKGMPLARTEGMIDAGLFPINYFSVSQLAIFMDDTVEGVAEVIKGM